MRYLKANVKIIIFTCLVTVVCGMKVKAQSVEINNVRYAMKTGSSKELAKFLNDRVDLNIDWEQKNYSKVQAEFILKDFFQKNPPEDFQYIHQGASKEGLKYAIGKYSCSNGSFRILIRLKQVKGQYLVYAIDFTKE
jgi:hypothetical protein